MTALPCRYEARVTDQVQSTINLLTNLDELHPEVLLQHGIEPFDYKHGLVFRSAIESIRGSFIASSTTGRQGFVGAFLHSLHQLDLITGFRQTSGSTRTDFEVQVAKDPPYFAAIEVKGGEGNSINISDRPIWASEFAIWSHLDGAVVNQPHHDAHSIINRITNEMCRRGKMVDALYFKDMLCGTRARPCPKYPSQSDSIGLETAPDVFLFPQRPPSPEDPNPPVHTLETLRMPRLLLRLFGITKSVMDHVWEVHVRIVDMGSGNFQRLIEVIHKGKVVDSAKSRPWRA